MPQTLSEAARALLDSAEFATIATINPDGQPQLSVVWVTVDGNDLLVSTFKGRRKHLNLERDPRATLLVSPRSDPQVYVEVRGTVTMTEEGGPELIQQLSHKYFGKPFTGDDGTDHVRVVVRITPERVVTRNI
jgi:PPOX class probable F420-dependent enzyme